jgi:hypothetical protein
MQDRVYIYRPICALCMVSEHMASYLIYHMMNLTAPIPSLQRTVGHLFGVFIPFWNQEIHYRIYSSSSVILIPSLMNPYCVFVHYFSRFRNYSCMLFGGLQRSLFVSSFASKIYVFLYHTCHMPNASHHPWLGPVYTLRNDFKWRLSVTLFHLASRKTTDCCLSLSSSLWDLSYLEGIFSVSK